MKTLVISMIMLAFGLAAGFASRPYLMMVDAVPMGAAPPARPIDYWVAPMDPHYRRDQPGKSPMGMDLVPVYQTTGATQDPHAVIIAPAVINNLGVRTSKVFKGPIAKQIKTVGYVGYDETKINHVHLRTSGWIEKLHVKSAGETVKRGQVLFELYSPAVVNAQEEYLQVMQSNIKSMQAPATARLRALGMALGQIKQLTKRGKVYQRIRIYAPRSGHISKLNVGEGMYVKPEMNVMTIADLSSVWLLVDVFERQANWVAIGQKVDANFSYSPGTNWNGVVDYIYPDLDPMTRTFKVRLRFDNPDGKLKPHMYGKVKIFTQEKPQALSVAREAIIRSGQQTHVILQTAAGSFKQQPVTIGIESGDAIEILSGLQVGDTVVTSAQFLIDSEAALKASFTRMHSIQKNSAPTRQQYQGSGIIAGVKHDKDLLTLTHDAIPALGWPQMTMDFAVDQAISLQSCKKGASVTFTMDKHNENTYIITDIVMMEGK